HLERALAVLVAEPRIAVGRAVAFEVFLALPQLGEIHAQQLVLFLDLGANLLFVGLCVRTQTLGGFGVALGFLEQLLGAAFRVGERLLVLRDLRADRDLRLVDLVLRLRQRRAVGLQLGERLLQLLLRRLACFALGLRIGECVLLAAQRAFGVQPVALGLLCGVVCLLLRLIARGSVARGSPAQ